MYKISVIGSGYVGLVAGACFADAGNTVFCLDINPDKIDSLNKGIVPIFEPGLDKLIHKNVAEKRLFFSIDISKHIKESDICFIAVGTPPDEDGSADLKYVLSAARSIGKAMEKYTVIVDKSTVPVGTADKVKEAIADELRKREADIHFSVVSNPEFLREGAAIEDFMKPDRVVIGCEDDTSAKIMNKLYQPFVRNFNPIITMDLKSAELTKYAANSMLALRISFMNEIANLCEKLSANVDMVRKGIGTDHRIGKYFLYSGIGYGGSCFPKDVQAIIKTADDLRYDFKILKAVEAVNVAQKEMLVSKIKTFYKGNLKNKKAAVWGLSFKANTDDMREAPSLVIINHLLNESVTVCAFDPEAMTEAKHLLQDRIEYAPHYYDALNQADFLIIATEWNEFRNPDFELIASKLKDKVIFDGRNLYQADDIKQHGLRYISIGRNDV